MYANRSNSVGLQGLHIVFYIFVGLCSMSMFYACSMPESIGVDGGIKEDAPPATPAIGFSAVEKKRIFRQGSLPAPPPSPTNKYADNPKAAHFGQYLFFDKRLSKNGKVSCATCHAPEKGWSDELNVAKGISKVTRNTPTLWNNAYNRWFFWDGRADTLWSQALGPIEAPPEMGFSRLQLIHFIAKHTEIRSAYEGIFGKLPDLSDNKRFPKEGRPVPSDTDDPHHKAWSAMTKADQDTVNRIYANVGKAIAAFERRLLTNESPFDTFVQGWKTGDKEKLNALSISAQRGLKIFVGKGDCFLCHDGPNFTDDEFHNIGLGLGKIPLPTDAGRYKGVTAVKSSIFNGMGPYSDAPNSPVNVKLKHLVQKSNNLGEFKTPSLRNVAETKPYMHDGRFKTLREVLVHYSKLEQKPAIGHREETMKKLNLTEQELQDLEAFLRSLSGKKLDPALLKQPKSPTIP